MSPCFIFPGLPTEGVERATFGPWSLRRESLGAGALALAALAALALAALALVAVAIGNAGRNSRLLPWQFRHEL